MDIARRVRPMIEQDLETVLQWRNHPEVRRFMYTQHEISPDEHRGWFERSKGHAQRHLLIYEQDAVPLGFLNIQQTGAGGIADWGFYVAPDSPQGTGRRLGEVALTHAFSRLGLHKICAQALSFNERSFRFHRALGFTQEGILRQQHFDGQHYHDVVCFGLLASEWKANH